MTQNADSATTLRRVERSDGRMWWVVDVMDFGAVGDGVADDAPAIQRALDAFEANPIVEGVRFGRKHLLESPVYVRGRGASLVGKKSFPDIWRP